MAPPGHDTDALPRDSRDAALRGDLLEPKAAEIAVEQIGADRVDGEVQQAVVAPLVWTEETNEGRIEVFAERARLHFASDMLVPEGAVRIDALRGERFEARQAVLARGERGLFLPPGHRRGDGAEVQDAVFLATGRDGSLRTSQSVPSRSYQNLLQRRERIVLAHYAEHALLAQVAQVARAAPVHP